MTFTHTEYSPWLAVIYILLYPEYGILTLPRSLQNAEEYVGDPNIYLYIND